MRTVSQVVEDIVHRSPLIGEVMSEGLANNASVARRIKPEVERVLMEEVSIEAIGMALHRLQQELRAPVFGMRYLKQLNDITVRSNLVEFSCSNTSSLEGAFDAISQKARKRKDVFLNFTRGLRESLLIVSREFAGDVEKALDGERIKRADGLSAVTMHLPAESLNVPGVYYPILKALAVEGISFVEVMSVRTEFSIILEDAQVDRAFSVLKRVTS